MHMVYIQRYMQISTPLSPPAKVGEPVESSYCSKSLKSLGPRQCSWAFEPRKLSQFRFCFIFFLLFLDLIAWPKMPKMNRRAYTDNKFSWHYLTNVSGRGRGRGGGSLHSCWNKRHRLGQTTTQLTVHTIKLNGRICFQIEQLRNDLATFLALEFLCDDGGRYGDSN